MKPEDLTIRDLEIVVGVPVQLWHGKCTALSHAAQKLVGGVAVYGDYCGFISDSGYWAKRSGFPNHHGWVLLDDGRVLDPTRWSFENKEPYIYIGDGTDYDEGGNMLRRMMAPPDCPPPRGKMAALDFENATEREFWRRITHTHTSAITVEQAMWVANLPYDEDLAHYAYRVLARSGFRAMVPIDNFRRADRKGLV